MLNLTSGLQVMMMIIMMVIVPHREMPINNGISSNHVATSMTMKHSKCIRQLQEIELSA
jgi:hypothetical protein